MAVSNSDHSESDPQASPPVESTTSSTRVIHFRDQRPPHEVRCRLERELQTLLSPVMAGDRLCFQARAPIVGADYHFRLCFEAAMPADNSYSFKMEVSWAKQQPQNHDYYRKVSGSWFELWTQGFKIADPPLANENADELYCKRCEVALNFEQDLNSIAATQQAIVAAFKSGACYRASYKEGGTNISWRNGRFIRSDFGEQPNEMQYADENEFLMMLFQFCRPYVSNVGVDNTADIDVWRLILRRLEC